MFQVIGDEVRFEDWTVLRFCDGIPQSVRAKVEGVLHETNYVSADRHEEAVAEAEDSAAETIAAMEEAISEARGKMNEMSVDLNDMREDLDDAQASLDAALKAAGA